MNNHASMHRNAKVYIRTQVCDTTFLYVHYQGIIVSADNIGVTIDGYSTSPLIEVYDDISKTNNAIWSEADSQEWYAHLKEQQQYGIYFLPWTNIAEVKVL